MREQGAYGKPAPAPGCRQRAQNVVKPHSPRKKAPPRHGVKTPAPAGKDAKGSPGNVPALRGQPISAREAACRRKAK